MCISILVTVIWFFTHEYHNGGRCNGVIFVWHEHVIVIGDYFHDYTRCLIFTMLYHTRDMVACVCVCVCVRQKITIELINSSMDGHIYAHDDLSVYSFFEHERKMCWNTASDVATIISHINRHFRLTQVKPMLVTQPAIVQGFFLTPSF